MLNHIKKTMVNTTDLTLTCTVCKYTKPFKVSKQSLEPIVNQFSKQHEKCGEKINGKNS